MAIGSTMTRARQEQIIRDLEAQGMKARRTKHGILIHAPDGTSRTISTMSDNSQGLRGDIAWFREHGLHHPADKHKNDKPKEEPVPTRAETNEDGYPLYMTGPINGTTRRRVLAELESKGWPLRVMPTQLNMDTVTASRALYAVGYRWDPDSPAKKRVWVAPDDIKEMHEKVKAEMKRREEEAKAARHVVVVERGGVVVTNTQDPEVVAAATAEKIESQHADTPDAPSPEEPPIMKPKLHIAGTRPAFEEPEREFIDSVDSWTANEADVPLPVREYLRGLRAAGLSAEIRVWRKS